LAYEDYTTYDEVDPDSDITVAASQLTITSIPKVVVAHLTDDKGVNHFGDFEHLVNIKPITFDNSSGVIVWGISDTYFTLSAMRTADEGINVLVFQSTPGVKSINLEDSTNDNTDGFEEWVNDTFYYLTINRASTTTTSKIYSDSDRTDLLDTLSITSTDAAYRRIIACASFEYAGTTSATINIYNLDLQEAPPPTHFMQASKYW